MKHGNTFSPQHFPVKCVTAYGTAVPYCTREMILGHANCLTAPTEQQHFACFIIASLHEEIRACFALHVLVPSCSLKVFNDSHLNSFLTLNSIKSMIENYVLKGSLQQPDQVVKLERALRGEVRITPEISPGLHKAYCYAAVGIVTRLQLERPRNRSSIYDRNEIHLYSKALVIALGPTQFHI